MLYTWFAAALLALVGITYSSSQPTAQGDPRPVCPPFCI
jgi:hypothetical protein